MTFRDIIDLWPTITAFADDVGVPYESAKSWRTRNSIRATHWQAIIEAAHRRGFYDVNAATMSAAAAAPRQRRKRRTSDPDNSSRLRAA